MRALFAISMLCLSPALGLAQDGAGALPSSSLFGATPGSPKKQSRGTLDITSTFSEGYDSRIPLDLSSRLQQQGGLSSMLLVAADYKRQHRRADVSGNFVTSLRYFPVFDQSTALGSSAGVGVTFRIGRESTVQASQTAAYSPSYLYQLFPLVVPAAVGDAPAVASDYRVDQTTSLSRATSVGVNIGSPRSNRITFEAARERTDFEAAGQSDLDLVTGRAKWARGFGRTATVGAEFEYRQGEFGYGVSTREGRLKVAAEYSPALSASRRAQLRFSLATSAVDIPDTANGALAGIVHKLEGDASVAYPVLFNWSVGGSYRRGVEYVAVLRAPVFSDAVRFAITGRIGYRLDVTASAGYVSGASLLEHGDDRFDTYVGSVRTRYSLTRSVAVYGEYLQYHYDFRRSAGLAPSIPKLVEQHGVRAGVMLWSRAVGR